VRFIAATLPQPLLAAGNVLDQDPNAVGLQGKVWYFTTQV
jgi:hypothetical protein